jgi:thiol:disulfide interchange protein
LTDEQLLPKSEKEFDGLLAWDTNLLVLFTAPSWCVPCRQFEPHWNKAQTVESLERFTFVKVDMGESPENTAEHWATTRFGIRGVPQLLLWKVGATEPVVVKARSIVPLIKELNE